jgi:predicted HAD superfamily hydrolase
MYVRRKEFLKKKAAAIKIETHFRAYYARQQFKLRQAHDRNTQNLQYFAQQAILIQKVFRGYFVRKYINNFYMRKS